MKAVILAGGEGTRLRPLTLSLPKPVVPVVDRPFLQHQLDLLVRAGVREVVLSLAYRPERIQAVFGDGSALGLRLHYVVEETPLGTGGAVRNALSLLDEQTVVLNGDVLTDVALTDVVGRHVASGAKATIVLTPVPNPTAYGLVETDAEGRVRRFLEKPKPEEITTDTINAGIYVLERSAIATMAPDVNISIERVFFPALLDSGALVLGPVHRGYWIDIGTPEKYLQVHQDVLRRRFDVTLAGERRGEAVVHAGARVDGSAVLEGCVYVGPGCHVEAGARIGPEVALVRNVRIGAGASVRQSVLWDGSCVGPDARLERSLVGPAVRIGASAALGGVVLGEGALLGDFSRTF